MPQPRKPQRAIRKGFKTADLRGTVSVGGAYLTGSWAFAVVYTIAPTPAFGTSNVRISNQKNIGVYNTNIASLLLPPTPRLVGCGTLCRKHLNVGEICHKRLNLWTWLSPTAHHQKNDGRVIMKLCARCGRIKREAQATIWVRKLYRLQFSIVLQNCTVYQVMLQVVGTAGISYV
jgi:hypothetical protein